uniref:SGNH/GDSL hydrolase family protein n=1 Tax=uncultured Dysgonomonas sp. TaxID=206096 RepID=UPI00260BD3E8|nr:GDSL-type esterase/lipase family protein [uncultured Dysgonomonas sp.]
MAQGEVQQFQLTKITDLPQASTIEGLVTIGVDNTNNSVKVPIELLKGNKGDSGEPGAPGEVTLAEFNPVKDSVSELNEAVFTEIGGWEEITGITWEPGYYVDLNGAISGGGTNTLYKLSSPIPIATSTQYKALLQAGNLLAVSGWNNTAFAPALAIVGADTNNPLEYPFTTPSNNISSVRLTCRKELAAPKLYKFNPESGQKVNRIEILEEQVDLINQKGNNGLIASFQNFAGSNTLTGTGTILGGGTFNYPVNIAIEDLDFFAKIKVNTVGVFGLCRPDTAGYGTVLAVHDNIAEIRKMNSGTGTVIYTYTLPFTIIAGSIYIVRMYKKNKDVYFSIHSDKDVYTGFAERLDNKDFGRNWGNPSVFCQSGQIEVLDAYLRDSNFISPLTSIYGDSLVEGWALVNELNKRYAALMQQVTGGNVEISGRGGENTTTLLQRFNAELLKVNSNYVMPAIGTNDTVIATYTTNMNTIIAKVKAQGRIPILATVTPRSGYPIVDMNTYVRNSGELYVDFNKAVNNGTETIWNSTYVNSDNVHPNVAGNEVMFKRILFDLYFLFDTKKVYDHYKL